MQFYLNASIYTQLVYTTFVLTDFNIFSVTVMLFVWFRRRAHQVLVSGTTRHTHCAVVVEVAATIFRRRHVLDAVILPSVCGNVSSWFVNIILLMLTALTYYNTMVILIYCDDTLLYQTFAYFLRLIVIELIDSHSIVLTNISSWPQITWFCCAYVVLFWLTCAIDWSRCAIGRLHCSSDGSDHPIAYQLVECTAVDWSRNVWPNYRISGSLQGHI